jgi:hypothetical protein
MKWHEENASLTHACTHELDRRRESACDGSSSAARENCAGDSLLLRADEWQTDLGEHLAEWMDFHPEMTAAFAHQALQRREVDAGSVRFGFLRAR